MNIFSQVKILPSLMNKFSSVFLASDGYIESLLSADNFLTRILKVLGQLVYFACKWIMYVVDVVYFYILQLAGVSADTSIFDSASSDVTFRLLIENKESVANIIKNFIGIAIVLILVTAIIAIIKQQANAFKDKKARKGPVGDVLRSVFKSVLLIIITPMIALLGIVASSVLLQSLFNATNLSDTKSLSARVFNASASQANWYYIYAENGVRIPIKYKFTGDSKADAIRYTTQMIADDKFPSLSYFNESEVFINTKFIDPVTGETIDKSSNYSSATETWVSSTYYKYYDTSDSYSEGSTNKYKKFSTHSYEYYTMSEVIGYALDTMEPFYFVTIQELLESVVGEDDVLTNLFENYKVRLLKSNGDLVVDGTYSYTQIKNAINNKNYSLISYTSNYKNGEFVYYHIKDAVDEMEGAKYVMAYTVASSPSYVESINGEYLNTKSDGSGEYYKPEKYYFKKSSNSKYQKADLYYVYDNDKEQYVKTSTYTPANTYYYKIGENYFKINDENRGNFYYKDNDGKYQTLTLGKKFYSLVTDYYYAPLSVGVSVNVGVCSAFTSEYINGSSLITARGLFDDAGYPTAIRRIASGDIMFYRDDLEMVSDGNISDVGRLDQIESEEEESDEDEGFFQKVGSGIKKAWSSVRNFVSSLFNPLKLVPDLKIDDSKVTTTYTNRTSSVFKLEDGKLQISYFFSDAISSKLSSSMYNMRLNALFDPMSINYVILAIGSIMFLKVSITAVFGLISRSFNLFLLFLIYPVACATIPLDEADKKQKGSPYKKWSVAYTGLLFSTFGLILSINFVFIVIPAIDKINFFETENFVNNPALARIGNALYNPLGILGIKTSRTTNYNVICRYSNKLIRLIFQICAFSMVVSVDGKDETFYSSIRDVVGLGGGVLEDSPMKAVKKTIKSVAHGFNMVLFPQKAIKNAIEKSVTGVKKAADKINPLGGSSVLTEANNKREEMAEQKNQDQARNELISAINSGASQDEVNGKLDKFKDVFKM